MDTKYLELKMIIEELEKIQGRGTELVSYYVPGEYDISKLLEHLNYEYSTAQNIKDKTTRQNVMDAIAKIINYLKGFKKIPKNGLVIFCGNVSQQQGKTDIKLWAIEPPEPINIRLYRCDSKFVLDPLKQLLEPKQIYGLIVLDRGEATIGLLKGNQIIVLENKESWVPGKIRAGGQSSVRFQRLIEQDVHEWMKYIADKARQHLDKYKDKLVGILIGGPGPLKEKFYEGDYLPYYLKQKVIKIIDTGYSNESGLKELVEKAKDILEKTQYIREVQLVREFFEHLGKGDGLAIYGYEDVKSALENGAAKVILLSYNEKHKLKEILEFAKEVGAKVELISEDHTEGEQFSNFKIGAILRYRLY